MKDPLKEALKIVGARLSASGGPLPEPQAKALLKAFGIRVPESALSNNIKDAQAAAESIGYPVVLKIVSPDIIHKTDVGGVKVGIKDAETLNVAYNELLSTIKTKAPRAKITGVLVEKMAPAATEVIIGALRDPQFGPAVMFGLGGIFVEAIKDVSFRLAPVNEKEALEMIKATKGYPLLNGFRGSPPLDVYSTAKTILTISKIITQIEQITEIDLNPVLVYTDRILVVDARIILE